MFSLPFQLYLCLFKSLIFQFIEPDKEDIKELVEQPVKSMEESLSNPKRSKRKSAKKEISYEENDEFYDTPGNEDFFEEFPVKVDLGLFFLSKVNDSLDSNCESLIKLRK